MIKETDTDVTINISNVQINEIDNLQLSAWNIRSEREQVLICENSENAF